jgi:hypothetical protein
VSAISAHGAMILTPPIPISSFTRAPGNGDGERRILEKSERVVPIPREYLHYAEPAPYAVERNSGGVVPVMGLPGLKIAPPISRLVPPRGWGDHFHAPVVARRAMSNC